MRLLLLLLLLVVTLNLCLSSELAESSPSSQAATAAPLAPAHQLDAEGHIALHRRIACSMGGRGGRANL